MRAKYMPANIEIMRPVVCNSNPDFEATRAANSSMVNAGLDERMASTNCETSSLLSFANSANAPSAAFGIWNSMRANVVDNRWLAKVNFHAYALLATVVVIAARESGAAYVDCYAQLYFGTSSKNS